MAGDVPHDPAKALGYKEQGNRCFQGGDYVGAEALYTKAINHDPSNPLIYTNRAMALLHFNPPEYAKIIADSKSSIKLLPENMKAYYYLAQGQIELKMEAEALESCKEAHRLCVADCKKIPMGKGSSSIGPITELVLRCKKEWWHRREKERIASRAGLLKDLTNLLCSQGESINTDNKIDELQKVFQLANANNEELKKRKVPDWAIDDITFSIMVDPVVTKTGQSYDRSSLMEHLKRSPTDPLTREPLRMEDLRPNLALKAACEEFLKHNGWAVDW